MEGVTGGYKKVIEWIPNWWDRINKVTSTQVRERDNVRGTYFRRNGHVKKKLSSVIPVSGLIQEGMTVERFREEKGSPE